jgi:hypothetical protein
MKKFIFSLAITFFSFASNSFAAVHGETQSQASNVDVENSYVDSVGDIAYQCGYELGELIQNGMNEAARQICLNQGLTEPRPGQSGMRVVIWNVCIRKAKEGLWNLINSCLAVSEETH